MLRDLAEDTKALKSLEMIGPEIMYQAASGDFVGGLISNSFLGAKVSGKVTSQLSDEDPSSISQTGSKNHFKFYPAGSNFQQIDHFRQMMISGSFAKYNFNDKDKNMEKYG